MSKEQSKRMIDKEEAHNAVLRAYQAARKAALAAIAESSCTEPQMWMLYGRTVNLLFASHYQDTVRECVKKLNDE